MKILQITVLFLTITMMLPAESNLTERETLFDDDDGLKSELNSYGISPQLRLTQFYQGLHSGDGDKDFQYGGKLDLLLNIDARQFKLWDGLSLTIHAEANFGKAPNHVGGLLLPVNTALYFPGSENYDRYDLTSFYLGQKLEGNTRLLIGKINITTRRKQKINL